MERAYPRDVDCVWIAADRDGHVGAFVTAGVGPVPVQALDSTRPDVEDIEERLCRLPRVSVARVLVAVNRPDDFVALAERGLFVYDWSDVHRTSQESRHGYEPVAAPLTPINIGSLPDDVSALLDGIALARVAFSDGQVLDVRQYLSCREATE